MNLNQLFAVKESNDKIVVLTSVTDVVRCGRLSEITYDDSTSFSPDNWSIEEVEKAYLVRREDDMDCDDGYLKINGVWYYYDMQNENALFKLWDNEDVDHTIEND